MARTLEREYQRTHAWISFHVDLRPLGGEVWMQLGEARSKVEHLSLALLRPDIAAAMNRMYLAKGAHATTAIEGNTLSENDVLEIVEGRHEAPPSQEYLVQEVENVIEACNRVKDDLIEGGPADLTPEMVKRFNQEVLSGLDLEPHIKPGQCRTSSVVVGNYRGAPAEDCEYLIDRLCEWLNGSDFDPPDEEWAAPFSLIKAILAHLYLAGIHPFDDGNGRTARLMELQILLAAGMPMPAAHLLSNHYNATRAEYYRQLQHASRSGGDVLPFLQYGLQGFIDGIREQLALVWDQQYDDRWEQFIYQKFGDTHTAAKERQRRLVLELSKRLDLPLPRRELVKMTPELFDAYQGTERTLSRDLNALDAMGLIGRVRGGWVPLREQIIGFQPVRRVEPQSADPIAP
jgi:Fic family protein